MNRQPRCRFSYVFSLSALVTHNSQETEKLRYENKYSLKSRNIKRANQLSIESKKNKNYSYVECTKMTEKLIKHMTNFSRDEIHEESPTNLKRNYDSQNKTANCFGIKTNIKILHARTQSPGWQIEQKKKKFQLIVKRKRKRTEACFGCCFLCRLIWTK